MLLYVFLVLGVWKGVAGREEVCNISVYEVCNLPDDFSFLKTQEDWNRMCPTLLQTFVCLDNYSGMCGYDDVITEERMKEMWYIGKDACREESEKEIGSGEEVCQLQAERACRISSIVPNEFPGNIKDLRNICSNLRRVKRCIANTLRKCSSENAENNGNAYNKEVNDGDRQRWKAMQRLIDLTTQICDRKSELHRSFVPHLSCLRSLLETENKQPTCQNYSNNAVDFLNYRIQRLATMAGGNEVRDELKRCLREIFDLNCFITLSLTACDSSLKQPILEIIQKMGALDDKCPASSWIDVIELLDALKLVTQQEIYIKELLRVNSFF